MTTRTQQVQLYSFKGTRDTIDFGRIFAEASPNVRVLEIHVGEYRVLAMRKACFDRARAAIPVIQWDGQYSRGLTVPCVDPSGLIDWKSCDQCGWKWSQANTSSAKLTGQDLINWLDTAEEKYTEPVTATVQEYL